MNPSSVRVPAPDQSGFVRGMSVMQILLHRYTCRSVGMIFALSSDGKEALLQSEMYTWWCKMQRQVPVLGHGNACTECLMYTRLQNEVPHRATSV